MLSIGCGSTHDRRTSDAALPPAVALDAGPPLVSVDASVRLDAAARDGGTDAPRDVGIDAPAVVDAAVRDAVADAAQVDASGRCTVTRCRDVPGFGLSGVFDDFGPDCAGTLGVVLDDGAPSASACGDPDAFGVHRTACAPGRIRFRATVVSAEPGAWWVGAELETESLVCTCGLDGVGAGEAVSVGDTLSWDAPWDTTDREIVVRGDGLVIDVRVCLFR